MNSFISIADRGKLNKLLLQLQPGTKPKWGILTPLAMTEHLVTTIEYTNGKKVATCTLTPEQIEKRKQVVIYSDMELPMGIKTPVSKDDPLPTTFETISDAIAALNNELDAFEKYFENESATSVHPGFGELNYQEWLIFHGKHFTHHLKQFGIIE